MLVAVSGGPDSLALLLLAHAALGVRCSAMTVDHGLRDASADEARFVGVICAELGVEHRIATGEVGAGNVSAAARAMRYALLEEEAAARGTWIATAHHADDQLETMIMRVNRGSGVSGLACTRAVNGNVVRPLLNWRHSELVEIVRHCGVTAIDDPSNTDDSYDRARLRKQLADVDWLDALAVSRSAAALAEAEEALEWVVNQLGVQEPRAGVVEFEYKAGLPREIVRRLVKRAIRRLDEDCELRGETLARVIAALNAGSAATIGKVAAHSSGTRWVFELAPPRRPTG